MLSTKNVFFSLKIYCQNTYTSKSLSSYCWHLQAGLPTSYHSCLNCLKGKRVTGLPLDKAIPESEIESLIKTIDTHLKSGLKSEIIEKYVAFSL